MDLTATHLHLMFNHVPVLGTFFVAIVLGWGLVRRAREVTSLGFIFTVLLSLATIPVYLTGDPTHDQQEHATWFVMDRVHEHEEKAQTAFIALLATGAVALAAVWLRRGGRPGNAIVTGVTLAGLLVSAGLFAIAALEGGRIHHEELRSGVPAAITPDSELRH